MTQHNRETLLALADRAEKATGGDRLLDGEIAKALSPNLDWLLFPDTWGARCQDDPIAFDMPPPFTASLDAAMSLILADIGTANGDYWRPEVSRTHRGTWSAMISPPWNSERNTTVFKSAGDEATPALALVAAALRARATLDPTGEKA